jgi:hypothetical protein
MNGWLDPTPGVNYDIIAWLYVAGIVICAVLAACSYGGAEAVEGWWLIFLPFAFFLPPLLVVRGRARALASSPDSKKKDE